MTIHITSTLERDQKTYTLRTRLNESVIEQQQVPYFHVVRRRNDLCNFWSEYATQVIADAIPPIATLRELGTGL